METSVHNTVFDGNGYPVMEKLLVGLEIPYSNLTREMMESGHYTEDGLDVSKFLREDMSINLEKLELAVHLIVKALELNQEEDVTILLTGLDRYYELRQITDDEKQKKQEKTFILGFVSSVAMEVSERDTLVIKI